MITVAEYVTPTSATKSSSERLEKAAGVAAIGFIVLLVAVSIAQAREEQKNRKSRQERSAYRGGRRREPADSMADMPYGESPMPYGEPRPPMRMDDPYPSGPARRPGVQSTGGGSSAWGQFG